ncbi:MAG TPA: hypothetical protein ENJ56_05915, partial [Anaerolineae bacterium]|nr:hypothetical protein [Anaerolineae bacterium]
MAKFDNPLNRLKKMADEKPQADKRFENPLETFSAKDIAKATNDRSMAGQYKRKTISLPPGQVRYIKQIAQTERMGILETYRWLIDLAIRHYEEGERPEVE